MQDLSIAHETIRIVEFERRRNDFDKVSIIELRAGAFSAIDSWSLRFAFETIRSGTCAETAELRIDSEPARLICRSCSNTMPAEHGPQKCAHCQSLDLQLDGSTGFEIVSLEVD